MEVGNDKTPTTNGFSSSMQGFIGVTIHPTTMRHPKQKRGLSTYLSMMQVVSVDSNLQKKPKSK
jgi:hypothetical protein